MVGWRALHDSGSATPAQCLGVVLVRVVLPVCVEVLLVALVLLVLVIVLVAVVMVVVVLLPVVVLLVGTGPLLTSNPGKLLLPNNDLNLPRQPSFSPMMQPPYLTHVDRPVASSTCSSLTVYLPCSLNLDEVPLACTVNRTVPRVGGLLCCAHAAAAACSALPSPATATNSSAVVSGS
jgi:hypothetical protein